MRRRQLGNKGIRYSLVVTDNQGGASNASTNASVTVKYTLNGTTTTLGTTFKNGDQFIIPDGATNVTVTGSSVSNFTKYTTVDGNTYIVEYKAQKVTVSISNNTGGCTATLKNTTSSITVNSGTSSFIGYIPWGSSWEVTSTATTSKYPTISPSGSNSSKVIWAVQVNYRDYTLVTSGAADLGLPSGKLWSATNVGESNYYYPGIYFSWGDITGHTRGSGYNFNQTNYNNGASGSGHTLTASFTSGNATYDGARVNMGGTWRVPTEDEIKELFNSTYVGVWWCTLKGAPGNVCVSKTNSKGIFIPAVGYFNGTTPERWYTHGVYWSSTMNNNKPYYTWFYEGSFRTTAGISYHGAPIRAIKDPV